MCEVSPEAGLYTVQLVSDLAIPMCNKLWDWIKDESIALQEHIAAWGSVGLSGCFQACLSS